MMNQEKSTMNSDEPMKYEDWVIEFDPDLKVDFEDEVDFDYELDM